MRRSRGPQRHEGADQQQQTDRPQDRSSEKTRSAGEQTAACVGWFDTAAPSVPGAKANLNVFVVRHLLSHVFDTRERIPVGRLVGEHAGPRTAPSLASRWMRPTVSPGVPEKTRPGLENQPQPTATRWLLQIGDQVADRSSRLPA